MYYYKCTYEKFKKLQIKKYVKIKNSKHFKVSEVINKNSFRVSITFQIRQSMTMFRMNVCTVECYRFWLFSDCNTYKNLL